MTTWEEFDAELAYTARASRIEAEITACEDQHQVDEEAEATSVAS